MTTTAQVKDQRYRSLKQVEAALQDFRHSAEVAITLNQGEYHISDTGANSGHEQIIFMGKARDFTQQAL